MLARFKNHLASKIWFQQQQRILLAVSGGVDSVVMAHLFAQAGFYFGIAHCNFQLRGADSDGDEQFVKSLANQLSVPFYMTSFDTTQIAANNKQSIQMEARDLRYAWLEEIRQQEGFDWIATAHHLDDSIETLLYNFAKGCGIHGLQGIPERNGHIIRPLLFSTKKAVMAFQEEQNLAFREDVSNADDKYARNKIRHHIIPVLQLLNPKFIQTAGENINRLQDAATLMNETVYKLKLQFVKIEEDQVLIQKEGLKELPAIHSLLYEWLKPYGFKSNQIDQLLQHDKNQAGRIFYSQTHWLLDDRDYYMVQPLPLRSQQQESFFLKEETPSQKVSDGKFYLERKSGTPDSFPPEANVAYLQLKKEAFPLVVRHWQAGDTFQPLGMHGKHQKLQDFFTNQKVTRFEKSRIWIVETKQGEICWIVGYRIDERFKLMSDSKQYVALKFHPGEK